MTPPTMAAAAFFCVCYGKFCSGVMTAAGFWVSILMMGFFSLLMMMMIMLVLFALTVQHVGRTCCISFLPEEEGTAGNGNGDVNVLVAV
jgi:hypothetical protein